MKKMFVAAAWLSILLIGMAQSSWALSSETAMLLDLLRTKGVITENEAAEFTMALEAKTEATVASEESHFHSVQSLTDREEKRQERSAEGAQNSEGYAGVADKISLSGLLEANMTSCQVTDSEGGETSSSDLLLATAQLSADAFFNEYVNGHLALLYEEDPQAPGNNSVVLDEALVGIKGGNAFPLSARLGRMYVPFGHFNSHFISDPMTLSLGETNDTALILGYSDDIVDVSAGFFKGKVIKEGDNDQINSMVASAILSLPKGETEKLLLKGGVSYLSNLAASDGLEPYVVDDIVTPGEVAHLVAGTSAFLSLAYAETFFLDAEFLAAIDDFVDGDISFVNDQNRRPEAWNLEAAVRWCDSMELALRYGASNEAGTFLATDEYGTVLLYNIFDNTALAVEYLFQEFQDNSENRQATMQLAVEF